MSHMIVEPRTINKAFRSLKEKIGDRAGSLEAGLTCASLPHTHALFGACIISTYLAPRYVQFQ